METQLCQDKDIRKSRTIMSCRTPFGSNTLAWTPFSSRQTCEMPNLSTIQIRHFSYLWGQNHEIPCNFNEKSLLLDRAGLAGALFLPYYFKKLRHLLVQNSSAQRSLILIGAVYDRFGEDVSITRIGKRNALSLLQYRTARCFVAGFFNSRKK